MTNEANSQAQHQPPAEHHESAPDHAAISGRLATVVLIVALVAVVVLAAYGIFTRHHADAVLADTTTELAKPSVIALPPKPGSPIDSFVLPGNVTAYTDSPIYARTSGYLKKWYYGHWRAGEKRRAAGGDFHARARSAARAGQGRSRNCRHQRQERARAG